LLLSLLLLLLRLLLLLLLLLLQLRARVRDCVRQAQDDTQVVDSNRPTELFICD